MKKLPYSLLLTLVLMGKSHGQDWANLNRFATENQALAAMPDNGKRVVFMGNSITEGWKSTYPEFFKDKPYVNRGISGQTTPQMLLRFRQDVIGLKPALVVILAGTNDIAGNTGPMTLPQIAGNIISMAELAKANHIKVILCSVLPAYDYPWKPGMEPAPKIMELNAMIREYATKYGIRYVDLHSIVADKRNGFKSELAPDGVHPNRAGYEALSPVLEKAITEMLNTP